MTALEIGYRHPDAAQTNDTVWQARAALRRPGPPREAVFVTINVADPDLSPADFLPSVMRGLHAPARDSVDLLLIHWPAAENRVPFNSCMLALRDAQKRR